ncbi:MAG: deoxyribodipyrimidine photolyase [Myxococcota bacterium]
MSVPAHRILSVNDAPIRPDGHYVLYWMTAYRRTRHNFALQRAVELAVELGRPVLVLEALRAGYQYASDRLHRFVIDGMVDNARACRAHGVAYHPYLEPRHGDAKTLLRDFAERACAVVTDDFPVFFLPRMVAAAGDALQLRLETVDGNGLLPIRATRKVFARAVDFRRYIQKTSKPHLSAISEPEPLAHESLPKGLEVPSSLAKRWPAVPASLLAGEDDLSGFQIDHGVPVAGMRGGAVAARERWDAFLDHRLDRYGEGRNDPDDEVSSGLSAYLHWGHISTHELFVDVTRRESWTPDATGEKATAKREGWWGLSSGAESFFDELITWRELGFNMGALRDDYAEYDSLPGWARRTLSEHADDPRPHVYELDQFESAETHDELWNAAQRQLLRDGRIHNYLRMLWGKKILEWSPTPRDALAVMLELNNKYGLDGRDPNSYSGILWVLGRYDRAWGPERPIFGKVRYMTSDSTRKKVKLKRYLQEYGPSQGQTELF